MSEADLLPRQLVNIRLLVTSGRIFLHLAGACMSPRLRLFRSGI